MEGINEINNETDGRAENTELVTCPIPFVKSAMTESIKTSRMSREEIACEMNRLADLASMKTGISKINISLDMLNKWTSPSANHQIPLRLLPLFCRAVGNNMALVVFSKSFLNTHIVSDEDMQVLEWARSEIEARNTRRRAKRLAAAVGIE